MILEWGPGSGSPCWRRPKSTNSCPAAARPPPTALRTPSDGPSWRPTSSTAWVLSPRWVLQKEMSDPSVGPNGRILTELPTYPIKKIRKPLEDLSFWQKSVETLMSRGLVPSPDGKGFTWSADLRWEALFCFRPVFRIRIRFHADPDPRT